MNVKSIRGFIGLMLAIVVIIIVVIFAIRFVKDIMRKENVKDIQADLLLVQAKVETVKGNYSMNNEGSPLKGYKLTEIPEGINIGEFLSKNIIPQEEFEKYYILDSGNLSEMGLQELVDKYKGFFIVNYENFEVIYSEGYENTKGLWCYKLSDLNKVN